MYYFLPPDAAPPTLPLVPRRVLKNYENVKPKQERETNAVAKVAPPKRKCPPPIPPCYENVELREKKEVHVRRFAIRVTSPSGLRPPVPTKRAPSPPQRPDKDKDRCPVTPPVPRRREKGTEKSKIFKVTTSVPYCPVSPDSPPLLARESNRSTPTRPLMENDDSANRDNSSPYYSLPPDSPHVQEFPTQFDALKEEELDSGGEEDLATYLTLDEIQSMTAGRREEQVRKSPSVRSVSPPKVRYDKSRVLCCI